MAVKRGVLHLVAGFAALAFSLSSYAQPKAPNWIQRDLTLYKQFKFVQLRSEGLNFGTNNGVLFATILKDHDGQNDREFWRLARVTGKKGLEILNNPISNALAFNDVNWIAGGEDSIVGTYYPGVRPQESFSVILQRTHVRTAGQ